MSADSFFEDRGGVTLSAQESVLGTFLLCGLLIESQVKTLDVPSLRLQMSQKLILVSHPVVSYFSL